MNETPIMVYILDSMIQWIVGFESERHTHAEIQIVKKTCDAYDKCDCHCHYVGKHGKRYFYCICLTC